jgi:hypothetical protein
MEKDANVNALGSAEVWQTDDPAVIALELTDDKARAFAAVMNASGVAYVIGKLLDAAMAPAFAAATAASGVSNPPCPTDGTRLELQPGRSPTEVATMLTVGAVQLVVFLPLKEVLRATGELVRKIERSGDRPH